MSDDPWAYPRPLMQRPEWTNLNGTWDFALDHEAQWQTVNQVQWNGSIEVPFAPETPASGVGFTGFFKVCWYRRQFHMGAPTEGRRTILHFEAVDYAATVWVNGQRVADHEGGYTPFFADITSVIVTGANEIIVRAEDDPAELAKPRGKQDWQLEPHSIWYPRTSGIWQTVWLETVGRAYICSVQWTPNMERWELGLELHFKGLPLEGMTVHTTLRNGGGSILARDKYDVISSELFRRIGLSDPGIDDYRNELLWTPATPTLIHAHIELRSSSDEVLDSITSYTALRSLGIQGDRFVLNGRPYPLIMVLDQGYWPESGLTAPSDEALRHDIELVQAMGFNGVRKHQKIESRRYLYWADALGILVWEEMPSAYRYTRDSIQRLTQEWTEVIRRDRSHPCIVAWVPFNESWGVPDLPDSPAQRHYVQALYHLTKTLDPTRPVIGNDGWESVATDLIGIHDYDDDPERMALRYGYRDSSIFQNERPGGRLLLIGHAHEGQPIMLTEFGGIAYSEDHDRTWGYTRSATADEFFNRYARLLQVVRPAALLAGFCYTQFADTYQETNGLLYADRRPKVPLEKISLATRGSRSLRDMQGEWYWREQLMSTQREAYVVPHEDRTPRIEPRT